MGDMNKYLVASIGKRLNAQSRTHLFGKSVLHSPWNGRHPQL